MLLFLLFMDLLEIGGLPLEYKTKYLQENNIPHQLLFKNITFNTASGSDFKKSIQIKHETYLGVTGLKARLGELKEGLYLYCMDIDCKGIPKQGEELLQVLLDKFPLLKGCFIETTKSGGYHIFFTTNLTDEKASKIIFNTPYPNLVEVPPIAQLKGKKINPKLEVELFLDGLVTIAPTISREGNYTPINTNPMCNYIPLGDLQNILKDLMENSQDTQVLNKGNQKNGDEGGLYTGGDLTEERLVYLLQVLDLNGLRYKIRGSKVNVYAFNDGKNPDYIVNPSANNFYLWNKKDQSAKKHTIKEYVESTGRAYKEPKIPSRTPIQTFNVDGKYISEEVVKEIYLDSSFKRVLISSDTGSGKTYNLIRQAFRHIPNIKSVMVFTSNVVNTDQEGNKKNSTGVNRNRSIVKALRGCIPRKNIIFATIDKAKWMLDLKDVEEFKRETGFYPSEILIINDEAHIQVTQLHYRFKAIKNYHKLIKKFEFAKIMELTATPQPLNLDNYNKIYNINTIDTTKYKVTRLITSYPEFTLQDTITGLLRANKRFICLVPKSIALCMTISNNSGGKVINLDAKNKKDSDVMKDLIKKELIPKDYSLICTDILSSGININNLDLDTIILYGKLEPTVIRQFAKRPRNIENLDIFHITKSTENGDSIKALDLNRIRKNKTYSSEWEFKQHYFKGINISSKAILDGICYQEVGEHLELEPLQIDMFAYNSYVNSLPFKDLYMCFNKDNIEFKTIDLTLELSEKTEEELEVLGFKEIKDKIKKSREESRDFKRRVTINLIEFRGPSLLENEGTQLHKDLIDQRIIECYSVLTSLGVEERKKINIIKDLKSNYGREKAKIQDTIIKNYYKKIVKSKEVRLINNIHKNLKVGDIIKIKDIGTKIFKGTTSIEVQRALKNRYILESSRKDNFKYIKLVEKRKDGILSKAELSRLKDYTLNLWSKTLV